MNMESGADISVAAEEMMLPVMSADEISLLEKYAPAG